MSIDMDCVIYACCLPLFIPKAQRALSRRERFKKCTYADLANSFN